MSGRGRGGYKVRPKLPFKLTKELFGEQSGGGRGGGRGPSRRDRRKEERQSKKQKAHPPSAPSTQQQQQQPKRPGPASGKRGRDNASSSSGRQQPGGAAKKPRSEGQGPRSGAGGSGSRFAALLPAAEDPEILLQRQLARKLGLKKGKKVKLGGDDGFDELMEELGGLDDVLETDSEEEGPLLAKGGGAKRQQRYAAEAPGSGSEGEWGSEEEGRSDGDDELLHMGGISEGGHEHDDLGFDFSPSEEGEEGDGDGDGGSDSGVGGGDDGGSPLDSDEDDSEGEGGSSGDSGGSSELGSSSGGEESEEGVQGGKSQPVAAVMAPSTAKYVPPAARRALLAAGGGGDVESERVKRRVRGLVNRLAENNMPGIITELAELYQTEGRSLVSEAVADELVAAAVEGPRASERFAAVAAASVASLAALANSPAIVAAFLVKVAAALDHALADDSSDSLASGNLLQVAGQLFLLGAIKPDLIFSLLDSWKARFREPDIAAIAGLLHVAGLALRAADPQRMKAFVVEVHAVAAAAEKGALSARARVMLDLVVDIKNNRKRGGEGAKRGAVALEGAAAKWLKSTGVGAVALGGITWEKVLHGDKRGTWWMPTAADAAAAAAAAAGGGDVGEQGNTGRGVGSIAGDDGVAAPELLKLAAAMRMSTDTRKAAFCAIMGSEDAIDAVEKLLRLGLKGEQERELVRVTVECCLHEAAFNPYYSELLARLSTAGKSHRITLQFCLWDHFKEVSGMQLRRMSNLARLAGAAVACGAAPPATLKTVDFGAGAMSAREEMFWRLFFEHCLDGCKKEGDVRALFGRLATTRQLAKPMQAFLKKKVGPWLASKDEADPTNGGAPRLAALLVRCRAAELELAEPKANR